MLREVEQFLITLLTNTQNIDEKEGFCVQDIELLLKEKMYKVQKRSARNYYDDKYDILLTNKPIEKMTENVLRQTRHQKFKIINHYDYQLEYWKSRVSFDNKVDRFIELHCNANTCYYYVLSGSRNWQTERTDNYESRLLKYGYADNQYFVISSRGKMNRYYDETPSLIDPHYSLTGGEVLVYDYLGNVAWKPVLKMIGKDELYFPAPYMDEPKIMRIDDRIQRSDKLIDGYFYAKYVGETTALIKKNTIIKVAHKKIMNHPNMEWLNSDRVIDILSDLPKVRQPEGVVVETQWVYVTKYGGEKTYE